MENMMAAFTVKQMYSAVTIFHWLMQNKKTLIDLEEFLAKKQASTVHHDYIIKPCKDCKIPMKILPVNSGPGDQVGEDENGVPYKSQWICPRCLYAEYSIKAGNEEAIAYIKEVEQGGNK